MALLAAASAVGGAFVLVKAGPPVLEILERWVGGPRVLPLEDYVDSPKALEALRAGLAKVREGANLEAIPYFERAIAEDNHSILAHAHLIETLMDVGEQNKASEMMARLERIASVKARSAIEDGFIRSVRARRNEEFHVATEEFRVLVERFPDDLHLGLLSARHLEESGAILEALPLYDAMSRDSSASALGLGRAMSYVGQPASAIEKLWDRTNLASRPLGAEARGMMHSILGVTLRDFEEYKAAIDHLKRSLDQRTNAGDRRGQAASLSNLASVYELMGRSEQASAMLERALRLSREMGDDEYESYTLSKIARSHLMAGDPLTALGDLRQSLVIEWARQDHTQLAPRLNEIANTYTLLGLYEDAEIALTEADKHIGPSGQEDQRAYNCLVKGTIAAARGDFESSSRSLDSAVQIYEKLRIPDRAALTRISLAESHCTRGAYWKANNLFEEAIEALNQSESQFRLARAEVAQAAFMIAQGAFPSAEGPLARVERRLHGCAYFDTNVRLLLARGELSLARSNTSHAHECFANAIENCVRSGFKELEARGRIGLGRTLVEMGRPDAARSALEFARAVAVRLRLRPLEANASLSLSEVHLSSGDSDLSRNAAMDAIEIALPLSLNPVLFRAYTALGRACSALGEARNAAAAYTNAKAVYRWLLANVAPIYRDEFQANPDVRMYVDKAADLPNWAASR